MSEFLGKISSYNLFNYLFTGVLFVILTELLTSYSFLQEDILIGIFVYYFIGLVISRIGSLVIEPIFKKISFVKFASYPDFVSASKDDPQVDVLSEVNNMYRTLMAVFAGTIFLKIYENIEANFTKLHDAQSFILLGFLLLMFAFAYRKQTAYITKRIQANLKNHE